MEDKDYIIQLILKYLSGTISAKEEKKLNIWINSGEENRKTFNLFKIIWDSKEKENNSIDVKEAWLKVSKKAGIPISFEEIKSKTFKSNLIEKKEKRKISFRIMRFAAVFLIAFSLTYFFNEYKSGGHLPQKQELYVPLGKRSTISLSDGSKVILDAGSKLDYPARFAKNKREVFLEGEGYFEIKANHQRPFIIYANEGIIRVVGTKFNVSAWPAQNNEVKVVVVEGKVSFKNKALNKSAGVIIEKGKMSYISKSHPKPSTPEKADIEAQLAWIKRNLILTNTPLSEVLNKLSRWYNIKFQLPSPLYNNVMITGSFKNKSLNYILNTICLMTQLNYKKRGNTIIFFRVDGSK